VILLCNFKTIYLFKNGRTKVKLLNRISIKCFTITECYSVNILLTLREYSCKFLYYKELNCKPGDILEYKDT